jgi:hypothetical protein
VAGEIDTQALADQMTETLDQAGEKATETNTRQRRYKAKAVLEYLTECCVYADANPEKGVFAYARKLKEAAKATEQVEASRADFVPAGVAKYAAFKDIKESTAWARYEAKDKEALFIVHIEADRLATYAAFMEQATEVLSREDFPSRFRDQILGLLMGEAEQVAKAA